MSRRYDCHCQRAVCMFRQVCRCRLSSEKQTFILNIFKLYILWWNWRIGLYIFFYGCRWRKLSDLHRNNKPEFDFQQVFECDDFDGPTLHISAARLNVHFTPQWCMHACRLCCGFKVFIGHENCISSFQSECHWWRCSKIYHFVGLQWVLSTFTNQISSLLYIKNMDAKPHFAQNIEIAKYFKRTKSIGVGWNKCSRKTRKKTQLTELVGIWKRRHNWQGNIKLIGNL